MRYPETDCRRQATFMVCMPPQMPSSGTSVCLARLTMSSFKTRATFAHDSERIALTFTVQ